MTVKELTKRLSAHDGVLPVIIRCQWEGQAAGDPPPDPTFDAWSVVAEMDPDTGEESVIIECDQTD